MAIDLIRDLKTIRTYPRLMENDSGDIVMTLHDHEKGAYIHLNGPNAGKLRSRWSVKLPPKMLRQSTMPEVSSGWGRKCPRTLTYAWLQGTHHGRVEPQHLQA